MSDILFQTVERLHAPRPWGRVLDAGTGVNSIKWMQTLNASAWTAITADQQMKNAIMADPAVLMRDVDTLVVGNWMDEHFCSTLGSFDTILADYLIGAVDGFSPFAQDIIIKKLKNHLNPQGRLYIVGMQPIPDHAAGAAEIITEIRRARDACILLAGHRPYRFETHTRIQINTLAQNCQIANVIHTCTHTHTHTHTPHNTIKREYPLDWIERHLHREGMRVVKTKSFTILHSEESAMRQIRVAQTKLDLMPSAALKQGMERYLLELGERVKVAVSTTAERKIGLSYDYIVSAEREEDSVFEFAPSAAEAATPAPAATHSGGGGESKDP